MSKALHRTTLQWIGSGAGQGKQNPIDWLHNPDFSLVINNPKHHWVTPVLGNEGAQVQLKSLSDRNDADTDLQEELDAADRIQQKANVDTDKRFKAFAVVLLNEINILRAEHSLAARTKTQLLNAIKTQIDSE